MSHDSNQMEQHPVQCRNGCGFYGNSGTEGLCSVCYKEAIKKKQQPPSNLPTSLAATSTPSPTPPMSAVAQSSSPTASSTSIETASPTILTSAAEKRLESEAEFSNISGVAAALISCGQERDGQLILDGNTTNTTVALDQDTSDHRKDGKSKKNRCLSCRKKVGLTGFTCRCGGLFCSIHRYSDKHDCDFDYKELGAEEIRKNNPVVVASKIQKI